MGDQQIAAAKAVDPAALMEAIRRYIDEKVDDAFLEKYDAHSVDIAWRRRAKKKTPELCLVVYVEPGKKPKDPNGEPVASRIPKKIEFPDPLNPNQIIEIPTDVVEAEIAEMSGGKWRPSGGTTVPGGQSCCVEGDHTFPGLSGTIGGWAWDKNDHSIVMLSNLHILGPDEGRTIFHPDAKPRTKLGTVKRGTWETDEGRVQLDCAIGTVDDPGRAEFAVHPLGPAIMATTSARIDQEVEKVGGSSAKTSGTVVGPYWKGKIPDPLKVVRTFSNCIKVEPPEGKNWADKGDSGSLVFDREPIRNSRGVASRAVVGLHIGRIRRDGRWYGIACKIDSVFKALNLATLPEGVLSAIADEMLPKAPDPDPLAPEADAAKAEARRLRDLEIHQLCERMARFLDGIEATPGGRALLQILEGQDDELHGNRIEVVTILAQDKALRSATALLLCQIFDAEGVAEPRHRVIDEDLIEDMTFVAKGLIRSAGSDLDHDIERFTEMVQAARGKTIADFLFESN